MHRVFVTAYGRFLYCAWRDGRPGLRINTETGEVVQVFS